ncbi:hypothetical protein KIN20_008439 [Parelaphostrongylus tenuis]|uniref:Uncharacterized protein n=1 Tax=Parelaphostrongylus tenuis TaxID=148309 RepID=A0AAD5MWS4_PARTN|nr:hypothetical protein KIN20_008439 [Parelaphostrongylus tenuis]
MKSMKLKVKAQEANLLSENGSTLQRRSLDDEGRRSESVDGGEEACQEFNDSKLKEWYSVDPKLGGSMSESCRKRWLLF